MFCKIIIFFFKETDYRIDLNQTEKFKNNNPLVEQ